MVGGPEQYHCDRCDDSVSRGEEEPLVGGTQAILCTRCQVEWTKHLEYNIHWNALLVVEDRIEHAQMSATGGCPPPISEWLKYKKTHREELSALGLVGRLFVDDPSVKRSRE